MASVCVDSNYFQVNDTGELTMKPGIMGLRRVYKYAEPGHHQFLPTAFPWLARVRVRAVGGGGGSPGANAAKGETIVRPGGSGGGYSESVIEAGDLGSTVTVVVGKGGSRGGTEGNGGNGGDSSFGGVVIAPGGHGAPANQHSGKAADTVQGVEGPPAGEGLIKVGGGNGHGGLRINGRIGLSGAGGESVLGHGGWARSQQGSGTPPKGYGGGAGGALSNGTAYNGGWGGSGLVIVELYG